VSRRGCGGRGGGEEPPGDSAGAAHPPASDETPGEAMPPALHHESSVYAPRGRREATERRTRRVACGPLASPASAPPSLVQSRATSCNPLLAAPQVESASSAGAAGERLGGAARGES